MAETAVEEVETLPRLALAKVGTGGAIFHRKVRLVWFRALYVHS